MIGNTKRLVNMDPIIATVTSLAMQALTPLISKGWEEVGKSAFKDAYEALKKKLLGKAETTEIVKSFEANPAANAPRMEDTLKQELAADPSLLAGFAAALKASGALSG